MTALTPGGLSGSATGAASMPPLSQEPIEGGLEHVIARLITVGTYASVALLVLGFLLMLAVGIGPLSGGPDFDLGRLVGDLVGLRPAGFLWLGLLGVVATPAARVGAALVGYGRSGERGMAVVAALVLIVIALSVTLATVMEG